MVSGVMRVLKDSTCEREESPTAFQSSPVASRVALGMGMWGKSRQERKSMGTWVASATCAHPFPK